MVTTTHDFATDHKLLTEDTSGRYTKSKGLDQATLQHPKKVGHNRFQSVNLGAQRKNYDFVYPPNPEDSHGVQLEQYEPRFKELSKATKNVTKLPSSVL